MYARTGNASYMATSANKRIWVSLAYLGLLLGTCWWLYTRRQTPEEEDAIQRLPVIGRPAFTILYNKYYFDEIYRGLLIYPTVSLATFCGKFDYDWVINRIVDFFGKFTMVVADGTGVFDKTIGADTVTEEVRASPRFRSATVRVASGAGGNARASIDLSMHAPPFTAAVSHAREHALELCPCSSVSRM